MTERLEDVRRRRTVIDEIGEVVGALRAIAAAHSNEAQSALDAISLYEESVTAALARLAVPVPSPQAQGRGLTLIVGAAQGFCGGYPVRVAEAAKRLVASDSGLLVIGQRTEAMLEDAGIAMVFRADLPAAPHFVPALASEVTDALMELGQRFPGPIMALSGTDEPGLPVKSRRIWPPEPHEGASAPSPVIPPLTTLPTADLLRSMLSEALFAEVAKTIMQGLRIENRARVEAMARAQSNLNTRRAEVDRQFRQARQEQMTTEVIELSMGEQAT